MYITVNGKSLENHQLNKNFEYSFEANQDLTVDRLEFELCGLEEFEPTSSKSLIKANPIINCDIYNDDSTHLMAGAILVNEYSKDTGIAKVEIVPDIMSVLEKKIQYYTPVSEMRCPTQIIQSLLTQVNGTDYIDYTSYYLVDSIFASYNVYAGLLMNYEDYETSILDVIKEFSNVFACNVYLKNNKLSFYNELNILPPSRIINDDIVLNVNEKYTDDKIINNFTITAGTTNINSIDIDLSKGFSSRQKYGDKTFSISPAKWLLTQDETSNTQALYNWLSYCSDVGFSKIEKYEFPQKIIEIEMFSKFVDYFDLGDIIEYNSNRLRVIKISRGENSGTVIGEVV